jgi:hypothetical protein
MGPRLRQIDELNRLGLTPEQEAALLDMPIKTVREYQYRIRQMEGEHRPRGWHGHNRHKTEPLLTEHGELYRITSDPMPAGIPLTGRSSVIEERKEGQMPEQNRQHLGREQHGGSSTTRAGRALRNEPSFGGAPFGNRHGMAGGGGLQHSRRSGCCELLAWPRGRV